MRSASASCAGRSANVGAADGVGLERAVAGIESTCRAEANSLHATSYRPIARPTAGASDACQLGGRRPVLARQRRAVGEPDVDDDAILRSDRARDVSLA